MVIKSIQTCNCCDLNLENADFFKQCNVLRITFILAGTWPYMKKSITSCLIGCQLIALVILHLGQVTTIISLIFFHSYFMDRVEIRKKVIRKFSYFVNKTVSHIFIYQNNSIFFIVLSALIQFWEFFIKTKIV